MRFKWAVIFLLYLNYKENDLINKAYHLEYREVKCLTHVIGHQVIFLIVNLTLIIT